MSRELSLKKPRVQVYMYPTLCDSTAQPYQGEKCKYRSSLNEASHDVLLMSVQSSYVEIQTSLHSFRRMILTLFVWG